MYKIYNNKTLIVVLETYEHVLIYIAALKSVITHLYVHVLDTCIWEHINQPLIERLERLRNEN